MREQSANNTHSLSVFICPNGLLDHSKLSVAYRLLYWDGILSNQMSVGWLATTRWLGSSYRYMLTGAGIILTPLLFEQPHISYMCTMIQKYQHNDFRTETTNIAGTSNIWYILYSGSCNLRNTKVYTKALSQKLLKLFFFSTYPKIKGHFWDTL